MEYCAETLVAHHLAYSFLSKVFYETPSDAFIKTLVVDELFDDWPLESDQVEMQTGIMLLREFCRAWDDGQSALLKRDYARLFIGPDHLLAPPWESVYCSPERLLFERQTLEVRQQYQRFGMPIPNLNVEPDDHIGLELRFVAYLCSLGLAAIEQNQPEALNQIMRGLRSFFEAHVLLWAPDCLHNVIECADTGFYRGVGRLALGCLAHTAVVFEIQGSKVQA